MAGPQLSEGLEKYCYPNLSALFTLNSFTYTSLSEIAWHIGTKIWERSCVLAAQNIIARYHVIFFKCRLFRGSYSKTTGFLLSPKVSLATPSYASDAVGSGRPLWYASSFIKCAHYICLLDKPSLLSRLVKPKIAADPPKETKQTCNEQEDTSSASSFKSFFLKLALS